MKRGVTHLPRNNSTGYARTLNGDKIETDSGLLETSTYHINVFARLLASGMRIYGVQPFSLFPGVLERKKFVNAEDIQNYWQKMMVPYIANLMEPTAHYISALMFIIIYCTLIWNSFIFNQMDMSLMVIHFENLQPICMWVAFFATFFAPVLGFLFSSGYVGDSMRSKAVFTMQTATVVHNLTFCFAHACVFYAVMHYVNEIDPIVVEAVADAVQL